MPFNEENSRNDRNTEKFSFTKLSYSRISLGSFSDVRKFHKESVQISSAFKNGVSLKSFNSNKDNLKTVKVKVPEITGWRRAVRKDKPAIKHLQTLTGDIADMLYRKQNIDELIERSYLPIVQFDSNGQLISFTAYNPYPNIPSVPSFFWNDWLDSTYKLRDACPRNVLFIHYMVWQPEQAKKFLKLLLETSFCEFLHLKYIIIVKPPQAFIPEIYKEHFISVLPFNLEKLSFDSIQSLLVCIRTSIIHSLPIRTAFEEEFDVIMPFIKNHVNSKNVIGNACVIDFVNCIYNEEKKTLICEFEGHVLGIMILNLKIDLDILNEGFELAPFNGLRKRDVADENSLERESTSISQQSSTRIHDRNTPLANEFMFSQMNWELTLSSKPTDSSLRLNESLESFSSNSDLSGFSDADFSSSLEVNSSVGDTADLQKLNTALTTQSKSDFQNKSADVKVKMRTSLSAVPRFFFPKYRGQSNAFVIDFFAIDSDRIDAKLSSFDFLEAAFKIIPDRDYCVLIIPTDILPFPLLDLFVRVTPRIMSNFKQELYLCHKNSLTVTSMIVRNAKEDDLGPIHNFLRNVNESQRIYQDIFDSFRDHNQFKSFVLTIGEKIEGVSLLNTQDCAELFRLNFELSKYMSTESYNYSIIKHLILSPTYNNHARFFIRDIMRMADLTYLYYVCSIYKKDSFNILTMIGELVPIRPKKKAGLEENILSREPSNGNCTFDIPFSLHLTSIKLCDFRKFHLNFVIVVVGASRTALSFFEDLIFGSNCPYMAYNNLLCVTPHSLDIDMTQEELRDLMSPIRDNFSTKYFPMLSLQTYVSFIYGVMTEINRSEKYIIINNKTTVRYDYLILTCGLQYFTPVPKARRGPESNCKKCHKSPLARFLFHTDMQKNTLSKYPLNMFVINTSRDAKSALEILQCLMEKIKDNADKKIIIYGHNLHVFLTIHTLLKLGIPGEIIAFVEPFPSKSTSVTVFNDHQIDEAVLDSLKNMKVGYYKEYFLYDWSIAAEDYITSITFQSNRKQIVIPCLAFFPFVQKLVSDVTFRACNNAGLVYDGRLVINHNFRTNDKFIYAAGPFTKYSRRYYANDQDHQFCNSTEVGQKLAHIIKRQIDPTAQDEYVEKSDVVYRLKAPVLLYCQLPGNFNLLKIRRPGKELDLETAYNFRNYGEVLTTGDCKMKNGFGYFRLHLNAEGFVETITCFTRDKIDYVNLYSLYGLHERHLNNLLLRYDLELIPDLFAYFRQSWASAIFHEAYQVLREKNFKAFKTKVSKVFRETFVRRVIRKLVQNKWNSLSDSMKRDLQEEYTNSRIEAQIKHNLLQFLEFYHKDLPVYAIPSAVNYILYGKTSV